MTGLWSKPSLYGNYSDEGIDKLTSSPSWIAHRKPACAPLLQVIRRHPAFRVGRGAFAITSAIAFSRSGDPATATSVTPPSSASSATCRMT
jgi:hypothetical protein